MSEAHFEFSRGMYHSTDEKDACGIGMLVNSKGLRSHELLQGALQILKNLSHRGAQGSDGRTSDGAGILMQIPHAFFKALPELRKLPKAGAYAVGVLFIAAGESERKSCQAAFEDAAASMGLNVFAWRKVPVCSDVLGAHARALEPTILQVFVARDAFDEAEFERRLFLLRRKVERQLRLYSGTRDPETGKVLTQFYVSSLSSRTMILKGLMMPTDLSDYYIDLNDTRVDTAMALVHSRFSTNTLPAWELAQPFRTLCHNGEINTVRGNLNSMKAREAWLASYLFPADPTLLRPLIGDGQSDSASLDQAVEILLRTGRPICESMMCLIPEPWESNPQLETPLRDFYAHHASRMEPWDGPAAICFTDGRFVGTTLDRNGLRPCRYQIMDDGTVLVASEAGCLDWKGANPVKRGRLGPGEMLVVDLASNKIFEGREAKNLTAEAHPFGAWTRTEEITLGRTSAFHGARISNPYELLWRFGYSYEEVQSVLTPMFQVGEEPTSSMGNDTPPAVLSDRPQLLYKYFRQLFAQVTNPPIDPIREALVMSLTTYLGPRGDLLGRGASTRKRIRLDHPILDTRGFSAVLANEPIDSPRAVVLNMTTDSAPAAPDFGEVLRSLCAQAVAAVRRGAGILVLTDREISRARVAIPALLVTSAIHQHLIKQGLRADVSIVVETGEAREVHHFACLLGFGADAIHPYLALELARMDSQESGTGNYVKAIYKGLLKVMSKMGISTVASYRGSQLFEILGLGDDIVDRYFNTRRSRIGGINLQTLEQESKMRQAEVEELATSPARISDLPSGGDIHYRSQAENHLWDPMTISSLQIATRTKNPATYREFSDRAQAASRFTFRGLLKPRKGARPAIPLEEVESAASIVKRFTTGAMSFGALGKEAHESLAIAMNRIGGKSNSGEGGESAERYSPMSNGDSANSAIKQVASARFGVTAHYLVNARELQIKMAQGAKPGEGGQLPGHKVDKIIAGLRHSTPGVTLISPPPHHDIYSIEDLAQLIFDLKSTNPTADVSVKLVSTSGVGTVAAGVAKAHAAKITISGDGGGTGASPLSSIKHAGLPWELGLAEAHQTLVMNGLRERVRLETDGQLRNGHDVIVAAMLGAEEFGFSTAPLIVQGCLMMRKCHLNTCPVGVATQDPELRRKFTGQPEHLINYFFFIAEEVREILSQLGFKTLKELVGRVDCFEFVPPQGHWKASQLDLKRLLQVPQALVTGAKSSLEKDPSTEPSPRVAEILALAKPALERGEPVRGHFRIRNVDRAIGARLSGEIARRFGAAGLPDNTIELSLEGSAGQSFGAFLARGVTLRLKGESNDYLGKSLSGGLVILSPAVRPTDASANFVIAGNTCLYGATSGMALIAGAAGERFAVRNSGAVAVVEGVGDHGCEYMTGGRVVVLGPTGRNFAAGMSGGVAYVFDEDGDFASRCNSALVELQSVANLDESGDEVFLEQLIRLHAESTGSPRAERVLADWKGQLKRWVRIMPVEYKKIITASRVPSETIPIFETAVAHG